MDIVDAAAEESSTNLHISIFVTCLCDAAAVPAVPDSAATATRVDVHQLLARVLSPVLVEDDVEDGSKSEAGAEQVVCQGVGCASGPESLTRRPRGSHLGSQRGGQIRACAWEASG
jgi:ferric-chelate reductase